MSSTVSFLISAPSKQTAPGLARGRRPTCSRDRRARSADRVEALREAAGVALLGAGEGLEPLADLLEALVARGLREARVHLGVLVGLARDGGLQVVGRRADRLAGDGVTDLGEEVEVAERVARLTFGDGAEQRGD